MDTIAHTIRLQPPLILARAVAWLSPLCYLRLLGQLGLWWNDHGGRFRPAPL